MIEKTSFPDYMRIVGTAQAKIFSLACTERFCALAALAGSPVVPDIRMCIRDAFSDSVAQERVDRVTLHADALEIPDDPLSADYYQALASDLLVAALALDSVADAARVGFMARNGWMAFDDLLLAHDGGGVAQGDWGPSGKLFDLASGGEEAHGSTIGNFLQIELDCQNHDIDALVKLSRIDAVHFLDGPQVVRAFESTEPYSGIFLQA